MSLLSNEKVEMNVYENKVRLGGTSVETVQTSQTAGLSAAGKNSLKMNCVTKLLIAGFFTNFVLLALSIGIVSIFLSRTATKSEFGSISQQASALPGPVGETGLPGPAGETGRAGLPGPVGDTGPPGPVGDMGLPGPAGEMGLPGQAGEMGLPGLVGETGLPGPVGEMGLPGPVGDMGLPGPVGDTGPPGQIGVQGIPGLSGPPGQPGASVKGERGVVGPKGDHGSAGITGTPGATGSTGSPGVKGDRGLTGPPGSPAPIVGGVTYNRWGNSNCRSGVERVYPGRTGVSNGADTGGAANYVCMPDDPQYTLPHRPGVQGQSYIYGTEYELPPVSGSYQHNAPCAVCYIPTKHTVIMIPAKTTCPSGWTREYYGYIASESKTNQRTMYECVDMAMESIPGSQNDIPGGHFYFVEAHCNGLACPPYNNFQELNCAVCSK